MTTASPRVGSAWPWAVPLTWAMSTSVHAEASWACWQEKGLSLNHVGTFPLPGILAGLVGWGLGAEEVTVTAAQAWPPAGPVGGGDAIGGGGVCVCAREQGPCPVWADMGVSPAPPRLSCRILSHPRGASSQEWPPSRFLPAACPHGRFGLGCAHVCRCGQGAACDPVTGTCTCPPGRTGVHCEHGESRLLPRELEVMG